MNNIQNNISLNNYKIAGFHITFTSTEMTTNKKIEHIRTTTKLMLTDQQKESFFSGKTVTIEETLCEKSLFFFSITKRRFQREATP